MNVMEEIKKWDRYKVPEKPHIGSRGTPEECEEYVKLRDLYEQRCNEVWVLFQEDLEAEFKTDHYPFKQRMFNFIWNGTFHEAYFREMCINYSNLVDMIREAEQLSSK